jgi:hypothetical protein
MALICLSAKRDRERIAREHSTSCTTPLAQREVFLRALVTMLSCEHLPPGPNFLYCGDDYIYHLGDFNQFDCNVKCTPHMLTIHSWIFIFLSDCLLLEKT